MRQTHRQVELPHPDPLNSLFNPILTATERFCNHVFLANNGELRELRDKNSAEQTGAM
jgi:hypothetical protein